ncbi:recombinase [Mycobacteroides abscessus subsp. bolletii]|uniref:recombinase family protein n=1 Tax=Mycobacteroides abscessus TaxID=36809 RepID=UPI000927E04C|nr:recombinase family protein [Mycobacteroides abscessus]SHZ35994.1 recombinase [Mycobacteroides abscessus subsp. bolletii]SIB00727.1 recombinase [Mycobacteroides abscessus subsp. bolletii]
MRVAIYVRISADQTGEGLGIARQLEECLALAARLGWDVVAQFDDNDVSAYSGRKRRGFEAMLTAMAAGEFDALLCWHTDRLYRSMKDLERLIEIADARGVKIATVQAGELDLSTSAGRMMARILGSVARAESEHKAERHMLANAQKAAAGKWQTANRAFGYTRDGVPLEPEASAIKAAVADVLGGKSLRKIAVEWNAAGLRTTTKAKPWTALTVRRVLESPRYAALKVYRGQVVGAGTWEPLIDVDTHRGLVAFLSNPQRVRHTSFERKYIGSGIYRCGRCGGGPMAHAYPGGKSSARVYQCKAYQHVTRRGEPLDQYVEMLVLERLRTADVRVLLPAGGETVDVGELHAKRAALQARLDELAALFAEGAIDGSQLRRGTNELRTQLSGVDAALAELSRRSPVAELVSDRAKLDERWAALSPDLQGKVVDELMQVTVLPAPKGSKGFRPEYVQIDWR